MMKFGNVANRDCDNICRAHVGEREISSIIELGVACRLTRGEKARSPTSSNSRRRCSRAITRRTPSYTVLSRMRRDGLHAIFRAITPSRQAFPAYGFSVMLVTRRSSTSAEQYLGSVDRYQPIAESAEADSLVKPRRRHIVAAMTRCRRHLGELNFAGDMRPSTWAGD